MQRLVLFDIDETMISSDGAGRRAIGRALMDLFGVKPEMITVSMSGKTDPQILSEILRAAQMSEEEIQSRLSDMFELYISILKEELKKCNRYIMHKGIPEILEILDKHDEVCLGLLTGNIETGARLKLDIFDLNRYFPIGAYGSDSADRMELPHVANLRAKDHYGVMFRPDQLVIIGDSIYDVMCAKGYGARSIAVNTGVTQREALEEQDPDYLFATLEDSSEVLKAILA